MNNGATQASAFPLSLDALAAAIRELEGAAARHAGQDVPAGQRRGDDAAGGGVDGAEGVVGGEVAVEERLEVRGQGSEEAEVEDDLRVMEEEVR